MSLNPMHGQNTFNLEVTTIRPRFAQRLQTMLETITESEQQATEEGKSGQLGLHNLIKYLEEEIKKLNNGKFRFLIIGDFNRGKSTILNAFFGKGLLPMGVTPTTAIPTFVKHGEGENVLLYKKDGKKETLSLEEYKSRYTLNSAEVKSAVKYVFKSLMTWLNTLDYAEFYYPIDALSRGVEFIDTPGLNHIREEETQKTFYYIQKCHAILFVLAADQQFTSLEQDYLERFLGIKKEIENEVQLSKTTSPKKSNTEEKIPIFYLINKWDNIQEDDKEEVREVFVEKFCEILDIKEDEAKKMWGDRVFDVCAKRTLEKLKKGESIDDTEFKKFQERLNSFLTNERLQTELHQACAIGGFVAGEVTSKINERLSILEDDQKTLEEKINKTKPCVESMRKIVQILEKDLNKERDACINEMRYQYSRYFTQLVFNLETEFKIPQISGLKARQREEYTKDLEKQLTEYKQTKLENWHVMSQGIASDKINAFENSFNNEMIDYEQQREAIKKILNPGNFNIPIHQTKLSMDPNNLSEKLSLDMVDASATRKMILGAVAGTVGTVAAGTGGAAMANLLGANAFLGVVGVGFALTPLGWALAGASAVVGGGIAWQQRRVEIKRFQEKMLEEIKKAFQELLKQDKILFIEKQVIQLFDPYNELVKLFSDDIESLEASLNNLLESKRTSVVNCTAEKKRLNNFFDSVSSQFKDIETEYNNICDEINKVS